jgi:hypothetical protein
VLLILTIVIAMRKDMQSLKMQSPMLLVFFLIGTIFHIALITVVYANAEVCVDITCETPLSDTAKIAGYLVVCFAEPLLFTSYMFRFLRIKRIFDAQQEYFKKEVRPSDMIRRYSEQRLLKICILGVAILTGVYLALGVGIFAADDQYGVLPTFDLLTNKGQI